MKIRFPSGAAMMLGAIVPLVASARDITVNVDMTEAGRQLTHPTPDHPAFYLPKVVGYVELGSPIAGEEVPQESQIIHQMAGILASQGYLVSHEAPASMGGGGAMRLAPPPSLLLVFFWGSLNPVTDEQGGPPLNQPRMIALMAGKGLDNFDVNTDFLKVEDVMQGTEVGRYFIVVAAYDFDAWFSHHKKVQLWTERVSTERPGLFLPQIIDRLVATAGPYLGRETIKPVWVGVPEGTVTVGVPVVKGVATPEASVPAPASH
jgi:hypothetical protein